MLVTQPGWLRELQRLSGAATRAPLLLGTLLGTGELARRIRGVLWSAIEVFGELGHNPVVVAGVGRWHSRLLWSARGKTWSLESVNREPGRARR